MCNASITANTALIEFRGKMMLSAQFQHKTSPKAGRPGVIGFIPYVSFYQLSRDMEVCIDSRTYGNDARYVQQSCSPNSEVSFFSFSLKFSLSFLFIYLFFTFVLPSIYRYNYLPVIMKLNYGGLLGLSLEKKNGAEESFRGWFVEVFWYEINEIVKKYWLR